MRKKYQWHDVEDGAFPVFNIPVICRCPCLSTEYVITWLTGFDCDDLPIWNRDDEEISHWKYIEPIPE